MKYKKYWLDLTKDNSSQHSNTIEVVDRAALDRAKEFLIQSRDYINLLIEPKDKHEIEFLAKLDQFLKELEE